MDTRKNMCAGPNALEDDKKDGEDKNKTEARGD